jgi:exodeoxyribonuclease III
MLKIISWNINGIRAGIKKDLWDKVTNGDASADILCFQETKSDADIMNSKEVKNSNFEFHFNSCKIKKGYSGVANYYSLNSVSLGKIETIENGLGIENLIFDNNDASDGKGNENNTKQVKILDFQDSLEVEEFDNEGRFLITFFQLKDIKFALINCYFPQGGRAYRIPFKLNFYNKILEVAKNKKEDGYCVIITGDFNTTVADIDLARPKENRKTTGCLPEEREVLNNFFNAGFIDTYRHFYPNTEGAYTYWDQITRARDRNVGWRIDYFLIDQDYIGLVKQIEILSEVYGSDHCPVRLTLG